MADYQLTASEEPCAVIRTEDGACIPPDEANRDYAEYRSSGRTTAACLIPTSSRSRSPRSPAPRTKCCSTTRTAFAPSRASRRCDLADFVAKAAQRMMTLTETTVVERQMTNVDHNCRHVANCRSRTVQLAAVTSDAVIGGLSRSPYLLGSDRA